MRDHNLKKSQIAAGVAQAIQGAMAKSIPSDQDLLADKSFSWDDLNQLKTELGGSVMDFMQQVNGIVANQQIIANLGDRTKHFQRLIQVFYDDLGAFSSKVKTLREQHEHRSGPLKDLSEFNQYNRLAIEYHNLYGELTMLMTPTLSDLMITISEVTAKPQEPTTEATNVH